MNLLISDGRRLVASRFACTGCPDPIPTPIFPPSLHWLRDHPPFTRGTIIASEPIFTTGEWISCPENSILVIGEDLNIETYQL